MLRRRNYLLNKVFNVAVFRYVGACLAFFVAVLVGRYLSIDDAGVFFLYSAVALFISTSGRLYLDKAIIKTAAERSGNGEPNLSFSLLLNSLLPIFITLSALICLFYLIFSVYALEIKIKEYIYYFFLSIPLSIFVMSYAAILIGQKHIYVANIVSTVIPNLIVCSMFCFGIFFVADKVVTLQFVSITYFVGWLVSFFMCLTHAKYHKSFNFYFRLDWFDGITFLKSSFFFSIIGFSNITEQWATTIISGIVLEAESAAYFSVVSRIVSVVQLVLVAISSVFFPYYVSAANDKEISNYYTKSVLISSLVGLPVIALIVVFSVNILSIFGPNYLEASSLLIWSILAQVFNVVFGSSLALLLMKGFQRSVCYVMIFSSLINVLGGFVAGIYLGMNGVLACYVTSIIVQSLLGVYILYRKLGINFLTILRHENNE